MQRILGHLLVSFAYALCVYVQTGPPTAESMSWVIVHQESANQHFQECFITLGFIRDYMVSPQGLGAAVRLSTLTRTQRSGHEAHYVIPHLITMSIYFHLCRAREAVSLVCLHLCLLAGFEFANNFLPEDWHGPTWRLIFNVSRSGC